jgi:DNA-binding NarL/FixJ family response regulator
MATGSEPPRATVPVPIRVLLADDDLQFLAALERALESWPDIEIVAVAHDGDGAVCQFAATRPEVSLLDLAMPRGDGIDVMTRIRALDADATILILSGEGDGGTLARCLGIGATGCIRKSRRNIPYVPVAIVTAHALDTAARSR